MVKKVLGIIASIGMALFMLQLLLLTVKLGGVEAYPAPPAPATPISYPAQNQPGWGLPPTQPPQPTQTPPNLPYQLYMPLVAQPCPFRFGIGSATQGQTDQVIPNCSVPAYRWDLAPNPDSPIQMIRRCHSHQGVSQQYICWLVNHPTYDSGTEREIRTNIARVSTPGGYPPTVSSTQGLNKPKYATDNKLNTEWVSNSASVSEWLAIDLHPAYVDLISITWGSDYAKSYQIEVKNAGSNNWTPLYTTNNGNGGIDTIPISYAPLVEEIRIYLTEPAINGHEYSLFEFQVFGNSPVPLFQRGVLITQWISLTNHLGNTWFIGNEPDNFHLAAGDGMSPTIYADFYVTLATLIKTADPTAQIVFCQGSFAYHHGIDKQFRFGGGPAYCQQAYEINSTAIEPLIDAVATHQYIEITITHPLTLSWVMAEWVSRLDEFVEWTDSTHDWGYKPLYLTEYGDFDNRCPFLVYTNPQPEVCGAEEDGYAFWGGHYQEGFWAVQHHTTQYFLSDQNHRWDAAWWFVLGWEREEAYRGGLYENPLSIPGDLNYNGEHLHDSISCWLYGLNCPPPLGWDN